MKQDGDAAALKMVKAELVGVKGATTIARKKKPVTARAAAEKELFGSLVKAVYGERPGNFAEGELCAEASDIVRGQPAMLQKYLPMRSLTATVRGGPPASLAPPSCCLALEARLP